MPPAVKNPLNRREARHVRDNDPVMSNRDWGIDLPEKLQLIVDQVNEALEEIGDIHAFEVKYDDSSTLLGVDNAQDAIEALKALITGAVNQERSVRVAFAYNTPSPLYIATQATNEMIVRSDVIMAAAFDGATAALALGSPSTPGAIFDTTELKPKRVGQYQSQEVFQPPGTATDTQLTITSGGSSTGSGYVLLTLRKV